MRGQGKVISIFTPKGGTGKTTTAVNLALWLSDPLSDRKDLFKVRRKAEFEAVRDKSGEGADVCLIDTDGLRCSYTLLGQLGEEGEAPAHPKNLADYLMHTAEYEDILAESAYSRHRQWKNGRVGLIDGDVRLGEAKWLIANYVENAKAAGRIDSLFDKLRREFEYIVIDFPYAPNISDLSRELIAKSDKVLLVISSLGVFDLTAFESARGDLAGIFGNKWRDHFLGVIYSRFPQRLSPGEGKELEECGHELFVQLKQGLGREQFIVCVPDSYSQQQALIAAQPLWYYRRYVEASIKHLRVAELTKRAFHE